MSICILTFPLNTPLITLLGVPSITILTTRSDEVMG